MTSGTMAPLRITDYSLVSCLGRGRDEHLDALSRGVSGLAPCRFFDAQALPTWVGEVSGLDEVVLPDALAAYTCRNNQLAWLALHQDDLLAAVAAAAARHGRGRVGVFVGTSTSGIHQTERAYLEAFPGGPEALPDGPGALPGWYAYRETHNVFSVADFVRRACGLEGVASAISTACSSGAKAFAAASRAIDMGWCDAAVVGGVDSLCLTTLYGFHSLQLLSPQPCRPFDAERCGISIGEAAAFALLEKRDDAGAALLGYGESGDAYHMSSPHPQGEGAYLAMRAALARAGKTPAEVDYINLHGTGTRANDSAESQAVARLFPPAVAASSTKGATGHTLGAAGMLEACFSLLAVEHGLVPANLNLRQPDAELAIAVSAAPERRELRCVLSNSFGFGGSNCSLVLGVVA